MHMYYLNKLYDMIDKLYNSIIHRKFRFEHINIPLKKHTHNTTTSNLGVKFRHSQTLGYMKKSLS